MRALLCGLAALGIFAAGCGEAAKKPEGKPADKAPAKAPEKPAEKPAEKK